MALLLAAPALLQAAEANPRAIGTPPTGNDDLYSGQKNKDLVVDAANGVLANDTEPDGDNVTANLLSTTNSVTEGTVAFSADGSFTFTPVNGFTGFATFTYEPVDDVEGAGNTATVVLFISNNGKPPEVPVASFTVDDATVASGTTVNFDGSTSQLGDGASLDNFLWDYGEGGGTDDTGATDNTTHQYNTPGLFIASLTVKDDVPLTSDPVFLPILVSDGTTGDGRLYVKKAQFAINWSKHNGGVDADKFKLAGSWNPSGFPADLDLTGLTVDILINGQSVDGPQPLDAKGKFASTKGSSPSLKIAFKAKNGAFTIAGSAMDLRGLLGVVDQNEEKTLPIAIQVILGVVAVDNADCIAQIDALYKSSKGKSAKGKFGFGKNATPTGAFVSLKTSATRNKTTEDYKISASGVIAGDLGTAIDPNGTMTLTIGSAATINIDPSDVTVTGSGVDTVIKLNKGAVAGLSKFTIANAKGKFQIATNELTGVGLDVTPGTLTEDNLDITLVVPTASGNLTFTTSVELFRKDVNSTKWKR